MVNLQAAIRDHRWNRHLEPQVFAAELGITTREYNRYEQGLPIDTESLMKILRWCFTDPDAPVAEPVKEQDLLPLEVSQ
jgi:DNA-binding transcriptional regulator YiaG